MMKFFENAVSSDQFFSTLIILILIFYFLYKEWPEAKKRIIHRHMQDVINETTDKKIEDRVDELESSLTSHAEMLSRDFARLNNIEMEFRQAKETSEESLEEMGILMRSQLKVLDALQELGAKGNIQESQTEIQDFLSKRAHKRKSL